MKAKFLLIYLVVISITVFTNGCQKKDGESIEKEYLKNYIEGLNLTDNINWVLILPGLGCHGCIEEGELFMKEMIKHKDIKFVLTRVESLKILQEKTGINIKNNSSIILDRNDSINVPTDNQIYPCIIRVKDGDFISHEFQSPKNYMALGNIKQQIEEGKFE